MFRIKFQTKKSVGAFGYRPPRPTELGGSEDWYGWNIMYKNDKLYSLQGWTLQKIPILWKKASSKSCLELNSLQKSHGAHMSVFSWSWVRELVRSACSKYYNVGKGGNRWTLGFNTAGNTDYMKKKVQIKFV